MAITFEITNRNGDIDLSERAKKHLEGGGWPSETLLNAEIDDISLMLYVNEEEQDHVTDSEPGLCQLQLGVSHAANKDTGRVFHAHLAIVLDRDDMRRLRGYLGFILDRE